MKAIITRGPQMLTAPVKRVDGEPPSKNTFSRMRSKRENSFACKAAQALQTFPENISSCVKVTQGADQ